MSASAAIHRACSLRHGNHLVVAAARRLKRPLARDRELLERLEAIRDESRCEDVDASRPRRTQLGQRRRRVRLEPAAAPEARLERERPLLRFQPQLAREQPRRRPAKAMIGIAARERATRQAVEATARGARAGRDASRSRSPPPPAPRYTRGRRETCRRCAARERDGRASGAPPRRRRPSRSCSPRTAGKAARPGCDRTPATRRRSIAAPIGGLP